MCGSSVHRAAELNLGEVRFSPQSPLDLLTLMCVSLAIIIKADCYVTGSRERERERERARERERETEGGRERERECV